LGWVVLRKDEDDGCTTIFYCNAVSISTLHLLLIGIFIAATGNIYSFRNIVPQVHTFWSYRRAVFLVWLRKSKPPSIIEVQFPNPHQKWD